MTGALSPPEPPAHHASHPGCSHILLSGSAGCSKPPSPSLLPFARKSQRFGCPPSSVHPWGSHSTVLWWLCWKPAPSCRSGAAPDPAGPPGAVYLCAGDKAAVGHPVPGLDSWSSPQPILSCRGSDLPALASPPRLQFMGRCSCTSCLWELRPSLLFGGDNGTTGPAAPRGSLRRSPWIRAAPKGGGLHPSPLHKEPGVCGVQHPPSPQVRPPRGPDPVVPVRAVSPKPSCSASLCRS